MGSQISKQLEHIRQVTAEKKILADLLSTSGDEFPGSDYRPPDRSRWIAGICEIGKLRLSQIVFPGTHDSATDGIGLPLLCRPFAQCQTLSVRAQLAAGARALDLRVDENRRVCHGVLRSYPLDLALDQILAYLSASPSEILVLQIRTEYGHGDSPNLDSHLQDRLGRFLIPHGDSVLSKSVAEVLPKQIICVWKPSSAASTAPPGGALWPARLLKDDWIDTDLPSTKFESNLKKLKEQPPAERRKYLYRVENTVTPQADNPIVCVRPVARRISPYARLFVSQAFKRGIADRLQVFSTDFIDADFVDACAGLTLARMEGRA